MSNQLSKETIAICKITINGLICDGDIKLTTTSELAIPRSEVRLGGPPPPRKLILTCSCEKCGVVYAPEFFKK